MSERHNATRHGVTFESDPGDEQPAYRAFHQIFPGRTCTTFTTEPVDQHVREHRMKPGTLLDLHGRIYEVIRWRTDTILEVRRA